MAQPDPNRNERARDLGDRLRELPSYAPPSGGWMALQQRLEVRQRRRRARSALLAMAACLVVTAGVLGSLSAPTPQPSVVMAPAARTELAQLMAQSRALESSLARQRQEVSLWDSASAVRAEGLEHELSIVDLQLAYARPPGAQRLWRDRVDLLSNLLRTHQEAGLVNASYTSPSENEL
jgi:hypothetical protein